MSGGLHHLFICINSIFVVIIQFLSVSLPGLHNLLDFHMISISLVIIFIVCSCHLSCFLFLFVQFLS